MEEKTLFEIPIYSMSEGKFNVRWRKKRKQLFDKFMSSGHTKESALQGVDHCYYPQWLWRYNQIIGYIKVSVTRLDVLLDLYCIMCDRLYVDSSKKQYIVDWYPNGTHFNVVGKTNDEIKQGIRCLLQSIEKDHLNGRYYIDYTTFNNIFENVDIKTIIENI